MYEMQESCYYSVLEVAVDASPSAIVRAYRMRALKLHPDKNPTADPQEFQAVKDAYEVLSDPEKRRMYDHYGKALKPHMGETFAQLAPMLLSFATGFVGSCARTYSGLLSARAMFGCEFLLVGVAGVYYCYQPTWRNLPSEGPTSSASSGRQPKPKREIVSVSDYATISAIGLVAGNLTGWVSASALWLCRSLLLGS